MSALSFEDPTAPHVNVAVGYQPQVLDIFPHVALPPVLVLSLFCPPFHGRAAIFLTLIALLYAACISSPWPPDVGDTRPMRYAMAGSWFFVLPVVEKLLLHEPERDFWPVDDVKDDKARSRLIPELSWKKLRWAFALVASPRGVGWNFSSRQTKAKRDAVSAQMPTRVSFVAVHLVRAVSLYLAIDVAMAAAKGAVIPERWSWDATTIGRIALLELLMGMSTYAIMSMQYELFAAVGVGSFLDQPEDWPPLFGDIRDCYTVANVWGRFWHDYIRQPSLGFSHAILGLLKVPRRSTLAYLIHLATAFMISGFFHILSISVVWPDHSPIKNLVVDMALFFGTQPLATIAEKIAIDFYARQTAFKGSVGKNATAKGSAESGIVVVSPSLRFRLLGYGWVITWFVFSGWWFVRPYNVIGMLDWRLPFSFCDNIF